MSGAPHNIALFDNKTLFTNFNNLDEILRFLTDVQQKRPIVSHITSLKKLKYE